MTRVRETSTTPNPTLSSIIHSMQEICHAPVHIHTDTHNLCMESIIDTPEPGIHIYPNEIEQNEHNNRYIARQGRAIFVHEDITQDNNDDPHMEVITQSYYSPEYANIDEHRYILAYVLPIKNGYAVFNFNTYMMSHLADKIDIDNLEAPIDNKSMRILLSIAHSMRQREYAEAIASVDLQQLIAQYTTAITPIINSQHSLEHIKNEITENKETIVHYLNQEKQQQAAIQELAETIDRETAKINKENERINTLLRNLEYSDYVQALSFTTDDKENIVLRLRPDNPLKSTHLILERPNNAILYPQQITIPNGPYTDMSIEVNHSSIIEYLWRSIDNNTVHQWIRQTGRLLAHPERLLQA